MKISKPKKWMMEFYTSRFIVLKHILQQYTFTFGIDRCSVHSIGVNDFCLCTANNTCMALSPSMTLSSLAVTLNVFSCVLLLLPNDNRQSDKSACAPPSSCATFTFTRQCGPLQMIGMVDLTVSCKCVLSLSETVNSSCFGST